MSVEKDIWTIAGAIYNGLNNPSLGANPFSRQDCAEIAESALYSLQFTDNDISQLALMEYEIEGMIPEIVDEIGSPRNRTDLRLLAEVAFDTFA